jgi:hypothetical protein
LLFHQPLGADDWWNLVLLQWICSLGLLMIMEYSCCSINLWVLVIDGIFWGWWNIPFFFP